MLKIQRSVMGNVVRLTVSGRIEAEHLEALRQMIESEPPGSVLVLDLEEVRLVDRDAVQFLTECKAAGVTLENCSTYVRECIASEEAENNAPHPKTRHRRHPKR